MKELSPNQPTKFEKLLSIKIEPFMQDWDIELADANRVEEFCDIYERESWTEKEKPDVMRLIIASFDERLREGKSTKDIEEKISNLLKRDYDLHKDVIEYWSLLDEDDEEDVFPATPFLRKVWQAGNSN